MTRDKGLIIVSSPTGGGKTTTLAAMVNYINKTMSSTVVTVEHPIEYIHPNLQSAITQMDVGIDTPPSFTIALKHALRQDPDVILIEELREQETAAAVLDLVEGGHLVLTAGYAPSAAQAVERIVDLFPPSGRFLAQTRLASLLVGVLFQVLVPRTNGPGRIAAVEIMLANTPVKNLIREGKIYQLPNVIRTQREIGMISLDEALVNLYLKRTITGESLLSFCSDRQEVEKLISKMPLGANKEL